jgi:hypothetical protein
MARSPVRLFACAKASCVTIRRLGLPTALRPMLESIDLESIDLESRRAGCTYAAGNESLPRKDNGVDRINNGYMSVADNKDQ